MIFKSLCDLSQDIQFKLLPKLPRDIGSVYGVPRSGMIPAAIIATALGAKLAAVGGAASCGARQKLRALPEGGKVLLVDDSSRTGAAMLAASAILMRDSVIDHRCVVYAHSRSLHCLDFCAEILDEPRLFQWNFSGTQATRQFCWEMDGVICTHPTVPDEDNAYRNHILNEVMPLYLPQVKVKAIVTDRTERWRDITESWLRRYGVQYGALYMRPWDPAGRKSKATPEHFKAAIFAELDGTVFIESRDEQASNTAALSGKPVLSVQSMRLYDRPRVAI